MIDHTNTEIPEEQAGLAREEWTHALAIVGRKSESALRIRGWLITVLAAISTGAFGNLIKIQRGQYLAVCLMLVLLFALMEFMEQLYHLRAMNRVRDIEEVLRGKPPYQGPRIDACMRPESYQWKDYWDTLRSPRFVAYQAIIVIGVFGIAFSL